MSELFIDPAMWQLIAEQLEKVALAKQGDEAAKDEIRNSYDQLEKPLLIRLIEAIDKLMIDQLRNMVKELATKKLSFDELLELPENFRNDTIMLKLLGILGPLSAEERYVLGHEGEVTSVAVTQDNKIVSGSGDGTVRIWDMEGNELVVCRGHEGEVASVAIAGDSKIVSGSSDRTVRIWDMSLLNFLETMNYEQAQAVCELMRAASTQQISKQEYWHEIKDIFTEHERDKEEIESL